MRLVCLLCLGMAQRSKNRGRIVVSVAAGKGGQGAPRPNLNQQIGRGAECGQSSGELDTLA